jgi:hypothetical protein
MISKSVLFSIGILYIRIETIGFFSIEAAQILSFKISANTIAKNTPTNIKIKYIKSLKNRQLKVCIYFFLFIQQLQQCPIINKTKASKIQYKLFDITNLCPRASVYEASVITTLK